MDGIAFSDVPREVVAEVGRAAADFAIGFATVKPRGREADAVLGGSGTLVRIDDMYGVLTTDHVLEYLPEDQDIGVVIPVASAPFVHRFTLAKDAVSRLRVGHGHHTREGPDIALLLISRLDAGSLAARKSFYALSAHCNEILRHPPARTDGLWVVCGFVDEFTKDHGPGRGFSAIKGFHESAATVWVKSEHVSGDFDYCEFEVGAGGADGVPTRFGGLSGGGLWLADLHAGQDGRILRSALSSAESSSLSPPRETAGQSSPAIRGKASMLGLLGRHEAGPPNCPVERAGRSRCSHPAAHRARSAANGSAKGGHRSVLDVGF